MLLTRTSSTTPPRPRVDLMRIPRSVPWKTQFDIAMRRTPPAISLPIDTPPWPRSIVQLVMVTFSTGRPTFRPCASRPDLIAMQSSPVLMIRVGDVHVARRLGVDAVGVGRILRVVDA